jgi:glucose uptake protein GlcU
MSLITSNIYVNNYKMFTNLTPIIVALIFSCGFMFYIYQQQQSKKDNKPIDYTQLGLVFTITFVITYMLYTLIADTSDINTMMNNTKIGDPPF